VGRGCSAITNSEFRINEEIRAREVRLILDEGGGETKNLGVVSLDEALELAEENHLDLVEVAPEAKPPVCKIMDFGKFQYEKQRRERRARKQQKNVEVKEIQLGPKTDGHHLGFKIKRAREWIGEGMKVKVRMKFKGREITHPEIGRERLDKIAEELSDIAIIEQHPNLEGRAMLMVLAPNSEKK
jgi:translation initiation factor IF-3